MIKHLGKGVAFLKSMATKENLDLLEKLLTKVEKSAEGVLSKMDELNEKIVENTEDLCEVLEVEFLNKNSLKGIFDNYGSKNYHSVALLKGKYDEKRDRRVFFVQKLDSEKKPVNESEVLCIYVNNVDSVIQQWFGDKEMVLINK